MTIINEIEQWTGRDNYPVILVSLSELYDEFPLYAQSSIRSAIRRSDDFQRVDRGLYEYTQVYYGYQTYSHSKRIQDTDSMIQKKHTYDLDIEMTIEGTAPVHLSHEEIDGVINPELVSKSIEMLVAENVFLEEQFTNFTVVGSEWKAEQYHTHYSNSWDVEVKILKSTGNYTFNDYILISENEFD